MGKTPLECRRICQLGVMAALSELCKEEDLIKKEESRIPTATIYEAFSVISKEFSKILPGFYAGMLEDILFSLGSFNIIWIGGDFRSQVVPRESKLAMRQLLIKKRSPEELKQFVLLSQRFAELIRG